MLVYCSAAPTAALAAQEANLADSVAGVSHRPADSSLLPDGSVIGSRCPKAWKQRHWLLDEVA